MHRTGSADDVVITFGTVFILSALIAVPASPPIFPLVCWGRGAAVLAFGSLQTLEASLSSHAKSRQHFRLLALILLRSETYMAVWATYCVDKSKIMGEPKIPTSQLTTLPRSLYRSMPSFERTSPN